MFSEYWQFTSMALAFGLGLALAHGWHRHRQVRHKAWPRAFRLNARPVFNTHERLLYRELKAALPQHVVLAKVNVLRFCQAAAETEARLWFDRLHTLNVTFAVCTPNGAVISVIDLDLRPQRTVGRSQRLKEAVLEACRIRYIRCQPGQWPRAALLASWALGHATTPSAVAPAASAASPATATPGPADASPLATARAELAQKLHRRRAERSSRFQDSRFASDSFFADDSRFDIAANSEPAPLTEPAPQVVVSPAARR